MKKGLKTLLISLFVLNLTACDFSLKGKDSNSQTDSSTSDSFTNSDLGSSDTSSTGPVDTGSSNTGSSSSTSSGISSSNTSGSSDSSGGQEEEPIIPTNFYTIEKSSISNTYYPGDTFTITAWTNYLVLDDLGRIFYTVANPGCGYGTDNSYYSHPSYQFDVGEYINKDTGLFTIPENCIGYSIDYTTYGTFANQASDGVISVDYFENNGYGEYTYKWNSLTNPWLNSTDGVKIGATTTENLTVRNKEKFRLSSIYDIASNNGITTYMVYAPYNDEYTISSTNASKIEIFDSTKTLINKGNTSVVVNLNKDDVIYIKITTVASIWFNLEVSLKTYSIELPYEINSSVNMDDYKVNGTKTSTMPTLKYTKRNDGRGLYVNSNNPENLTNYQNTYGSIMNKVLMRQDVTEKDVFFTFEHNNLAQNYYYGYRVTNTGSEDVYVTVKNLGYQIKGAGSWLGEDEWVKFYNTKFAVDTSDYTSSQMGSYNAWVGFSNTYQPENRKPITYRLPAGKYFYVMGGTTEDAYNNINVFNSANQIVNGGCSNGAVLFSVTGGSAEASFMIYNNSNASTINATDYVTSNNQIGYVSDSHFGVQYGGYDNVHGVVDADIVYTFNDSTASDYLPVTYTNPYTSSTTSGTAYNKITGLTSKVHSQRWSWYTHISYFDQNAAVGTDMTDYINVDYKTKQTIEIDSSHYDGRGKVPNIGNWMIDYIDTFTLVNRGSKSRQFRYELTHTGVILAFVRDENGLIKSDITPAYYVGYPATEYGDKIEDYFTYTITVPAKTAIRFSVDYNLLANSYGSIQHRVYLQ